MTASVVAEDNESPTDATRLRPWLGPAPVSEPPFDDEVNGPAPHVRGARSTRVRLTMLPSVVPLQVRSVTVPSWSREEDVGVCRTSASHLEPAARVAQALARALVEVLAGRRSVEQLRVHCAPEVFAGIRLRQLNPIAGNPKISAIRICEPADGAAEVTAVMRAGGRARAIAFRLQGLDGRWRITDLQLG